MAEETRKASLLVVFLTVFIDLLGFGMVLPLLPVYAIEFARQLEVEEKHVTIGLLIGFLMSSFSLMQFLFAPLWGRLSDHFGRRPVLMVGLAGSVVFYSLFGMATVLKSLPLLFVSRIGAGIAGATISTAQAYIADSTTLENRARGMALIGAAFGLGFTFGPLFGFLAVPSEGGDPGPGPGYAAAALSAGALVLAYFKLPESLKPGNVARRHWFDRAALSDALATPGVGMVLLASFVCVVSFASFESTLALMVKEPEIGYGFDFKKLLLTFAFVGFVLTVVQGGLVRPLARRAPENLMATAGAAVEIAGFVLLALAATHTSVPLLFAGLTVIVSGFAFITPSLNSLLSRWSDPAKQGGVLGIGQSLSSLARIVGPMIGVPLFESPQLAEQLGVRPAQLPSFFGTALMIVGLLVVVVATSRGRDYATADDPVDVTTAG